MNGHLIIIIKHYYRNETQNMILTVIVLTIKPALWKNFRKGEPIHRCLTCGFDDTCALCSHCFQPEYHEGHKVHIGICQRENGGVCDCGDPEAWTQELFALMPLMKIQLLYMIKKYQKNWLHQF